MPKTSAWSSRCKTLLTHPTVAELAELIDVGQARRWEETSGASSAFELVSAEIRSGLPADVEDAYPLAAPGGNALPQRVRARFAIYHDCLLLHLRSAVRLRALGGGSWPTRSPAIRCPLLVRPRGRRGACSSCIAPRGFAGRGPIVPAWSGDGRARVEARRLGGGREEDATFDWRLAPLMRICVHPARRRCASAAPSAFTTPSSTVGAWPRHHRAGAALRARLRGENVPHPADRRDVP
jgi:hypothetical protein